MRVLAPESVTLGHPGGALRVREADEVPHPEP